MSQLSSRLTDLKKWRSLQAAGSVEHVLRTREGTRYTQCAPSLRHCAVTMLAVSPHSGLHPKVPELQMRAACDASNEHQLRVWSIHIAVV